MTDLSKTRDIYAHRLNLFAQYEQNCMFEFKGRVFDAREVLNQLLAFPSNTSCVVLARDNSPLVLNFEDHATVRQRAQSTASEALVRYAIAMRD